MGSGFRDGFNDYIADGDFNDDTSFSNPIRTYRRKKKNKSNRKRTSHTRRRKRLPPFKRRVSKSRRKSKRKGMSKEFLRNLRRKHGLGEFKKR